MPRRRDHIDDLLAQGGLGGPGRDRVLGRVLESVQPARSVRPWRALALTLGALSGGAAAVALWYPRADAPETGLRAKGASANSPLPSVTPLCPGGDQVCGRGDRLLFRVDASPDRRWMLAFAEPVGPDHAPAGPRIWIFPTAAGEVPEIPVTGRPFILGRGMEIDSSFEAGAYRLTLLLADHPMTREQAAAPDGSTVRLSRSLIVR